MNVSQLISIYSNEKSTNTLLSYKPIVDEFIMYLEEVEENSLKYNNVIINELVEIELNRIKFYIKQYLLIRLEKIRKNIFVRNSNLSTKELAFKKKYMKMIDERNITSDVKEEEIEFVGVYNPKTIHNIALDEINKDLTAGELILIDLNVIYDRIETKEVLLW